MGMWHSDTWTSLPDIFGQSKWSNGLPDLYCPVVACRGNACPIGRPCYSIYPTLMTVIGKYDAACDCIPHLHRLITASRSDASAIRRPCYGIDPIGKTVIGEKCVPGDDIPNSYDVIPGARGDTCSIRRPGQSIDSIGMIAVDEIRLLPANIPDMDGCVIPTRSNVIAVRRPCYNIDPVCMTPIGKRSLHRERDIFFHLPYLHRPIIATTSDILTAGRPREKRCPCIRSEGVTIGEQLGARRSIYDVQSAISGARNDIGAIWRPGQSQYEPVVVTSGEQSPGGP